MNASSTSRQADGGSFIAMPVFGKLTDLYGWRRLYLRSSDLVVSLVLCGAAGILPIPLDGMNQLIVTRGFLGQGNGAIIALIFTLVAGLFPPSELPPNQMWAIFQPKGDREGHDRSHALPQSQAGGNMQIHDKRLTHRFDGRVTLFDSVGIGELRSEPVPPHCEATRTMSASVGVAGAAARMAREPDASVAAPNEERLAERTRIAQDLHDTLLQGFFAVSMQLRAALNTLPEDCAERPRLSTVMQLLDRVLEEGRYFLEGLRSPNERKTSLGKAFARVPNDLGFSSAVGFRVIVLGTERELSVSLCDDIYRIVREAIVNAYRHSGAKDIETEIEYRASDLRFAVRDNGCGIDPQDLQWGKNGHWGLQGMRERADRIGGRLRVLSRSELGTEIELRVPC